MQHVCPIREEEMAATFLRTELASTRFGPVIGPILNRDGQAACVIEAPDLSDAAENDYRARVLGEYRGYRRNADVFTDVPDHVRWYRAVASREDLAQVRYIDYDYWTELSGGSRL